MTDLEDTARELAIRDGKSCGMTDAEAAEWAESCWDDFLGLAAIQRVTIE